MDKQINNSLEENKNEIPVIRTFEHDLIRGVKDGNITGQNILSRELDSQSEVFRVAENIENKKKITVFISMTFLIFSLSGAAFGYYYFFIYEKPVIAEEVKVKEYFIKDVWTLAPNTIIETTGSSTSTKDSIIIKIKDFDTLYPYLLNNESSLNSLAKNFFKYNSINKFSDLNIENNDLRISDGENGPIIYGYYKKDYLIITNSIQNFIKIIKSLK